MCHIIVPHLPTLTPHTYQILFSKSCVEIETENKSNCDLLAFHLLLEVLDVLNTKKNEIFLSFFLVEHSVDSIPIRNEIILDYYDLY